MIAYDQNSSASVAERPRIAGSRAGRTAAQLRRARTARLRRRSLAAMLAVLVPLTLVVVGYLALMANVTRLSYELGKENARQAALLDRTSRLEDRIAQLASRERLEGMAARLGMRAAQSLTVATLLPPPPKRERPRGLAFRAPIATGWLR